MIPIEEAQSFDLMTIIWLIVAAVILIVLLVFTFFIVQTNQVAVIERFGRFKRIANAGINVKIPFIDQVVNRMSLRIMQLDETVKTITLDKVTVTLNVSVQYRVRGDSRDSLYLANYALTDAEEQIASYIFDAVRSTVPVKTLDEVFAEKDHIARSVNNELSDTMDAYGYEIVRTLVTGVSPDPEVEKAMNRINAAERMKEASRAEAEAYRIEIVGKATGDKEAKELSGQGVALQRKAIADGLAVQHQTLENAGVKDIDMVLLMNQYMDTQVQLAASGKATTVFLPGGADAVGTLADQLRTSILSADAGKPREQ